MNHKRSPGCQGQNRGWLSTSRSTCCAPPTPENQFDLSINPETPVPMKHAFLPSLTQLLSGLLLLCSGVKAMGASGGAAVILGCGLSQTYYGGDIAAISAGYSHDLLLKRDGRVEAWGNFYTLWREELIAPNNVPVELSNVVAVAAGQSHDLALLADGTVVSWGFNPSGQRTVPKGLKDVVAVAAGFDHSLALRSDGTVVAWGASGGAAAPEDLRNVVAVSAGSGSLALKGDGTVAGWGWSDTQSNMIASLRKVVAISAGGGYWLALKADGTLAGDAPPGLAEVEAISCAQGSDQRLSLALRADGTVTAWGYDHCSPDPYAVFHPDLSNIVAIAAGGVQSTALVGSGAPFITARPLNRVGVLGEDTCFAVQATGAFPLRYQWKFNEVDIPGATRPWLAVTNLESHDAGEYSVQVVADTGNVTSRAARLQLVPLAIEEQPQDETGLLGSNATLRVRVTGHEPIEYYWTKDGTNFPSVDAPTLVLSGVRDSDSGRYAVVARNQHGEIVSHEATVTIVPALVTSPPQDVVSYPGSSASFTVAAEGDGPISYQWRHNGVDLTGATERVLQLSGLRREQAGSYAVQLRNPHGTVISRAAQLSLPVVVSLPGWQASIPPHLTNVVAIEAQNLALTSDGRIISWGNYGAQDDIPAEATNIAAICAGRFWSGQKGAIRADGEFITWETSYLPMPGTNRVVAAAIGPRHYAMLQQDGTVRGGGKIGHLVPANLSNVVAVTVGALHGLALRRDGTVTGWGSGSPNPPDKNANYGQATPPPDVTNVVAISAGMFHSLALLADGTVRAFGFGNHNPPPGLSNVVQIVACETYNMALRADGTVVTWGPMSVPTVPEGLTNVIAIALNLALVGDGRPALRATASNPVWSNGTFSLAVPTRSGHVYQMEYKDSLTAPDWSGLPLQIGNGGQQELLDPEASQAARWYRVREW